MPEAEDKDGIYLFKRVRVLRASHQVKLLAAFARASGRRLAIIVPAGFTPASSLAALMETSGMLVHLLER